MCSRFLRAKIICVMRIGITETLTEFAIIFTFAAKCDAVFVINIICDCTFLLTIIWW